MNEKILQYPKRLECPQCGDVRIKHVATRLLKFQEGIVRYHLCPACGNKFKSVEEKRREK